MKINRIYAGDRDLDHYYFKKSWIALFRPMTLTGTISPALAGTAISEWHQHVHISLFIGVLLASLLIQAATNLLNDYYDFKNGQDADKWTDTPGHGQHLPAHHMLPVIAGIMMTTAALIGIWLAWSASLWLIVVGGLGITAGYVYSAGKHSLAARGLGELTAAIFLGPVITLIAYSVQGAPITPVILMVSFIFALLIAAMILTNNIRDLKKDQPHRNTLANRLGRQNAVRLLGGFLALPYIVVFILVAVQHLPQASLLVLGAIPVAVKLHLSYAPGASRQQQQLGMKWAARHHWTFGILLAVSLLLPHGFNLV